MIKIEALTKKLWPFEWKKPWVDFNFFSGSASPGPKKWIFGSFSSADNFSFWASGAATTMSAHVSEVVKRCLKAQFHDPRPRCDFAMQRAILPQKTCTFSTKNLVLALQLWTPIPAPLGCSEGLRSGFMDSSEPVDTFRHHKHQNWGT